MHKSCMHTASTCRYIRHSKMHVSCTSSIMCLKLMTYAYANPSRCSSQQTALRDRTEGHGANPLELNIMDCFGVLLFLHALLPCLAVIIAEQSCYCIPIPA